MTEYESIDLTRCYDALRDADADGNGVIDAEEHLVFLQTFGSTDYWSAIQERPLELKAKFNAVACMCIQRGSPPNCCHGKNAGIDISGILEDNRQDQEYIETVCILTQRAIDEVERQRIEESENGETTSVWLQTAYQVALISGNSQSEEEVLQDLGEAMNVLVGDVIEEETSQAKTRERSLQEIEYLPTRIEWKQAGRCSFVLVISLIFTIYNSLTCLLHIFVFLDCKITIPAQDTCYDVNTFTYVVGPQNELDEEALESSLVDAIASGKLQDELDTINPDSSLRIIDEETTPIVTEKPAPAPTPSDTEEDPTDTGHDWSAGAITGLALAGVGVLGLAAGLSYKRNQEVKRQKELQEQMQASLQGSIINKELRDTSLEHDLDDLEKGNGGGGILLEDSAHDSQQRVSYKMDQVGLEPFEDDALPPPPPADPTLVVLPFGSKRQASREPSSGDLQASNNIHMDSLNSSTTFALTKDRYQNASSGSIGAMTPVNYNSAMGLDSKASNNDDSSYASSSSSSISDSDYTEGDTDSQESSSSSGSSEYDQYGIMKARAYEARLAEARSSMQERTLEDNTLVKDTPQTSANAGILGMGVTGAAGRESNENDEPVNDTVLENESSVENVSPSQIQYATDSDHDFVSVEDDPRVGETGGSGSGGGTVATTGTMEEVVINEHFMTRDVPENNATVPTTPDGPNTGLIAGVTAGAVGAIALGGAAIYAATRDNKDGGDETSEKSAFDTNNFKTSLPQMQSETAVVESTGLSPVAGTTSFASIRDPVAVGEESHLQLGSDELSTEESNAETISSTGVASADNPITVGEEPQMIDDPVAVGEESQLIENESSTVSAHSSSDIHTTEVTSLSMMDGTEGGDSALESTLEESGSSFTQQSRTPLDRVEESTMLRPPPRPPSPTDEGPSLAGVTVAGAGFVGMGATAAYIATRGYDSDCDSSSSSSTDEPSEASSEDYSDDSSDSSSDSDSSDTFSESHAGTNIDSQGAMAGVPVGDEGPVAVERARPPPSGSDHPYYAAAAVSTAVATGAVYDFSESGYSTSSHDRSADLDEPDRVYETSADGEEPTMSSVPEGGIIVGDTENSFVGGNEALTADSIGVTTSDPRESLKDINVGSTVDASKDREIAVTSTATTGLVPLAAVALTTGSEASQSDGGSSKSAVGYVEIPSSSVVGSDEDGSDSDSSSDPDSDDSSTGDITGLATAGTQSGVISTADATQMLSTNAGLASTSNRSVVSDVAVVQGLSETTDPLKEQGEDGNVSNVGVVMNEIENASIDTEASTHQNFPTDAMNSSAGVEETKPSTAAVAIQEPRSLLESGESTTKAAVVASELPMVDRESAEAHIAHGRDSESARITSDGSPAAEAESIHSNAAVVHDTSVACESTHAVATKPNAEQSEGTSTGSVVAGVVAGGTAVVGAAAAFALHSRSSTDEEPEYPANDDREKAVDAAADVSDGLQSFNTAGVASNPTMAVSQAAAPSEPSTEESNDNSTAAVIVGAAAGSAIASGATADALDKSGSIDDLRNSSNDEHTTDEESAGDELADDFTDVAVTGARSLSRSTLATSQAGTQSVSRSTLETSASTLQGSYPGQDGSSSGFYARESDSSLAKHDMESGEAGADAVVGSANTANSSTIPLEESSSSASSSGSSASYDSDSTDGYFSSGSDETSTQNASYTQESRDILRSAAASEATFGADNETPAVQTELTSPGNDMPFAHLSDDAEVGEPVTDVVVQENSGVNTAEMSESATATLTESGDTFLAMEEAAFAYADCEDVAVTKTRFDQGTDAPVQLEKPKDADLVPDVGIGSAAAVVPTQGGADTDSESESSNYTDTSDDSSVSSSSDSSSSDSSSYVSSTTESSDSSDDESDVSASLPDANDQTSTAVTSSGNPEIAKKTDLRGELRQVKSEGLISRKRETAVAPSGPGSRAQLLRARSDAMIAGSKRDETLQSLLTSWDQEYDITTGEEETTTSSEESLLVLYANAGLPPIVEANSDGSSQSLSLGTSVPLSEDAITEALKSGPLPEDAIAAAMQHGSSSLLNFDYSLQTVAEEQSGDMSGFTVDSSSTMDSADRAASIDQTFEKEVLQGLDTISELVEAPADGESKDTRDGSSGHISAESQGQNRMSDQELDDRSSGSSSYSSASSSEYTTESSVSSEDSDSTSTSSGESDSDSSDSTSYRSESSDDTSTGSSTSSGSPLPSSPDTAKALDDVSALDLTKEKTSSRPSRGQHVSTSPTAGERDMLADSETWAAIAGANKSSNSTDAGEDAAEWAIKRSLSALKVAEERAGTLASSSGSSFSSSEVSFSSDYTSSSDEES